MAGRSIGFPSGGKWGGVAHSLGYTGVWNIRDVSVTAPASAKRLVYHSALVAPDGSVGTVCPYETLPTRTTNFKWDILMSRDRADVKTLGSRVHYLWSPKPGDVVIKEIWDGGGGVATSWKFICCLYQMYLSQPTWADGEYMVWRPLDRNNLVYPVDMVNFLVDGEDMHVAWTGEDPDLLKSVLCARMDASGRRVGVTGSTSGRNLFTASSLEVWWRIRPEDDPNINVSLLPGSTTNETNQFEPA